MKHYLITLSLLLSAACFVACTDDDSIADADSEITDETVALQYYAGGERGTTLISTSKAYQQPTPVVNDNGTFQLVNRGVKMFEKPFTANTTGGEREGRGPLYLRTSGLHCHPGYGHGKSITGTFNTTEVGNGYLLVVYNPETNSYVTWLAGMPQGHAIAPFKDPVDETQVSIAWEEFTDEWNNTFPDGETYSLRYPEVTLPREAVYVINQGYEDATTTNYEVRLESTIGVYGTGLLDAITDEDLIAQYALEEADGYMVNGLNSSYWSNGTMTSYYSNTKQGDGTKKVRRFTYALSRGPLQDGPGANAIWNITNVTRSDRRYHYLDLNGTIYATYASKDPDVQADFNTYISKYTAATAHPEWFTDDVESNIYNYLTSSDVPVEMSDDDYLALMVWHRGLAVPAARNISDATVQKGKALFEEIGCAYCHRPSWTTGADEVYDPNLFTITDTSSSYYGQSLASIMPSYPYQTRWPYTDMVQHKLFMKNDIRTGWCRTTPLWGRGLHQLCTGSEYAARMHDCRARTVIEAIMWHGANVGGTSDAYYSVQKFRQLSKEERDAIVEFIDAI